MAESYLKALAEELSSILSSKSVIGEPIIQEDKVLIPVTKLGFAIGSGSGKSSGKETGGEGKDKAVHGRHLRHRCSFAASEKA